MKNFKKYTVLFNDSGIRIDRWLRRNFSKLPQSFFQIKLRRRIITLNEKKVKASKIIYENDIIKIKDYNEKIYQSKPLRKKILKINKEDLKKLYSSVIYENNDYLILNKWKGIPTQGGDKINNSIDNMIKNVSDDMRLVHRLDKETSGTLIISKNYRISRYFGKLFQERKITKLYLAICKGIPKKKKGKVDLIIKKNKNDFRMITSKSGQKSSTEFQLIQNKNGYSIMYFKPITGKMHQIRIVAKFLNCPILGDERYNKLNFTNKKEKIFKNLMLHSLGISFFYENKKKQYLSLLPESMKKVLKKLNLNEPKASEIKKIL